ncbi:PucR family transcriptional regulator [Amycolatopsis nigrescens]|uniref:PucR family transcriptional regulator n=1 Tax=Amycolatopsis nigrescens TaxID=381445 RepID=UPI00039AFDD2|nr:PucR family transcriptional regulator [Amycolatopsis nigrescens]
MNVSLRWLLDRPELGLTLVAGKNGLDRPLLFAHSIDLPDPGPWLTGGELILTTGAPLSDQPERQREYVHGVHRAGVAALGFGTGLSHDTIPPAVLAAADELGLPVLEVPLPTPFAAITKAVLDRLAEQRYEAVLRVSRAQPRMTRAALRGGAAAIVRELSTATGAATLFLGAGQQVEAACPRSTEETIAAVRSLVRDDAGRSASTTVVTAGRAITVQVVGVGNVVHGRLAVVADEPLGHVDQVLLGHAASLLALDREKPLRLRTERNRLGTMLLGLLLQDPANERRLRPQLADLVDPGRGVRVLVVLTGDPRAALDVIDTGLAERGLPLVAQEADGEAVILLPGEITRESVAELLAGQALRAGLSAAHPLDELRQALARARLAAAGADPGAGPAEFGGLAGAALLRTPASREVLDSVASGTIAKLEAHDPALVTSLRAFLEANGQWETAAAVVGVHRHTLRNRLDRVERLLGCDLGSARVRAELLFAALAWESRAAQR